nr:MAG TPA: putative cytoplasmic protein [Caudoviricetes sp.]
MAICDPRNAIFEKGCMMQDGKLITNCPHCGRVSAPHENYCANCGSQLRPPAKFCPKHGKMSGNYCVVCGSRLLTEKEM